MRKEAIAAFEFEEIACPLCGRQEYEVLCEKGLFDVHINVSICRICGFVYLNPRWRKEDYDYFYKELYETYFGENSNQAGELGKYSTIIKRLDRVMYFSTDEPIKVLDIGAGTGAGLLECKAKYPRASLFAIEPSEERQSGFDKIGITTVSRDVDSDWDSIEAKFDVIILRHVLEHLLYPRRSLQKIHEVLDDAGYLYVAVPNLDCASFPLTKDFFRMVHTLYFSERNFAFFLEENGFEVISIGSKDAHNFGELYAICKLKEKTVPQRPMFSEYTSSKGRILVLLDQERSVLRMVYWKVRTVFVNHILNSYLFRILGLRSLVLSLYAVRLGRGIKT
jgi:SAM-dependent methyltransferase